MNSKPIGLLTPNTIVCPSRYYANNIDKSISWFQAGKLIDPCKAKDITSTLYTFVMALVLFNLFRPAKAPRLVEGEEKNLLFLFGFVLCLEIIISVIDGDAF